MQELIAGGVDFVCCSLPEADAMLAGGQVRCLGVMAETRLEAFPDVPTFREQSHDWEMAGWRGIAAPKETPPDQLALLSAALQRVAESDELDEFMQNAGFNLVVEGPTEFAATLAQQDEVFHEILTGEAFSTVSAEHFGPMIFPSAIGGLLLMTVLIVVIDSRRSHSEPALAVNSIRPAVFVLVSALFYLLVAETLGFVLTTAAMLCGLFLAFRIRPAVALAIMLPVSALTYHVFAVLLRVPLPRGFLGW